MPCLPKHDPFYGKFLLFYFLILFILFYFNYLILFYYILFFPFFANMKFRCREYNWNWKILPPEKETKEIPWIVHNATPNVNFEVNTTVYTNEF